MMGQSFSASSTSVTGERNFFTYHFAAVLEIDVSSLPKDWKSFPHPHSTQVIGDNFVAAGKYLLMKVPSAVVQGDFNYLINPAHNLFPKVKIKSTELFEFDERLFIK